MDYPGNIDLSAAIKRLMAENKSKDDRLNEYVKMISSRDNEIEMLQSMLTEANESRSRVDNQLMELKDLQRYINDLQQQVAGAEFMISGRQSQVSQSSAEQQLENIKPAYTYLQSQVADLQAQLTDANNRNLLLQQQTSRIAALESLLEITEKERDELKIKLSQARKSNPFF